MAFFNKHLTDPRFRDRFRAGFNWVRLLFRDGNAIQAAELVEMQSLLRENVARAAGAFFPRGIFSQDSACLGRMAS